MQELDPRVLKRAKRIFADVPDEVAETGVLLVSDIDPDYLIEPGVPLTDGYVRESSDEVLS